MPSVGILLHETIKLMFHAKVVDPVFFRIGTSGGIGMEGGTVIISDEAVDGTLQPHLELVRGAMREFAKNYLLTHRSEFNFIMCIMCLCSKFWARP